MSKQLEYRLDAEFNDQSKQAVQHQEQGQCKTCGAVTLPHECNDNKILPANPSLR